MTIGIGFLCEDGIVLCAEQSNHLAAKPAASSPAANRMSASRIARRAKELLHSAVFVLLLCGLGPLALSHMGLAVEQTGSKVPALRFLQVDSLSFHLVQISPVTSVSDRCPRRFADSFPVHGEPRTGRRDGSLVPLPGSPL